MSATLFDPVTHRPLSAYERQFWGHQAADEVIEMLALCPRHLATPTIERPAWAELLGIGRLFVKDEGQRLGLDSFKALGGAFAVACHVRSAASIALKRNVTAGELRSDEVSAVAAQMTVACATDGNHGRSVAAGAAVFGCRAVVFMHPGASATRRQAVEALGARVITVAGADDDAVAAALDASTRNGWHLVSDTTSGADLLTPSRVMQGYTVMARELLAQLALAHAAPTHVFLQAGVGGFAAAIVAHGHDALMTCALPRFIIVEPEGIDCVGAGLRAGHPVRLPSTRTSVMGLLDSCGHSDRRRRVLR